MIHISIQSLSVIRFNKMYGIENESSSLAKKKQSKYSDYEYFDALSSSQNIQTMSIFTPCFMTTTDLLGARRSCGQFVSTICTTNTKINKEQTSSNNQKDSIVKGGEATPTLDKLEIYHDGPQTVPDSSHVDLFPILLRC